MSDFDSSSLRSVRAAGAEGELHLYSSDGETWFVDDTSTAFKPAQDLIMVAVRALSSIRSLDLVTDDAADEDLSAFGLDEPRIVMTLKDNAGGSAVIEFGSLNPSGRGRYSRLAGSSTVVIVPSYIANHAFKSSGEFRDMSLPSVKADSLALVSFQKDGVLFQAEPRSTEDPFVTIVSLLEITSPWRGTYSLDDYELQKLLTEETPLPTMVKSWEDSLDTGDEGLGLAPEDNPDFLHFEDTEGHVFHIVIGGEDGQGGRYCRFGDREDAVFTLSESDLAILNTDPFTLTSRFVFLGSITTVSQVKVERGPDSWVMRREERGEPEDIKDDRFIVNELETPQPAFSSVYQKFISVMWEGVARERVEIGSPEIRITVRHVDDAVEPAVIRFWPYDEVYYIAGVGDQPLEFLVGRYQVEDFIEDLAALSEFAS
ncbi:MAG: DUF4340 domain-containing protein [Spirochaetaceae bacterium]|nr:DUF4340 domain-containing protein [Spirochaetaceae bacterium]